MKHGEFGQKKKTYSAWAYLGRAVMHGAGGGAQVVAAQVEIETNI
jgi:hypothetical protein